MRRLRRAKIVATLGPASSDAADDREAVRGRRRRVPHQYEPHQPGPHARAGGAMIRSVEDGYRAADRHSGRLAGTEAAARHIRRRIGEREERRRLRARFRSGARRRHARLSCRIRKFSPASHPGHTLLIDDGKVRLTVTQAEPKRMTTRVEVGGKLSDRKGVSLPDSTIPVLRAGREGPLGPGSSTQRRHRLGGALLHPAAGGHRRGQENHARPRRGHGQDRKAASGASAHRNHGSGRRADGGARRSGRRNAAGKSAGRAEADDARRAHRRQAGGGRDANAGINDPARRCRRGRKSPTSPPPFSKAPTR